MSVSIEIKLPFFLEIDSAGTVGRHVFTFCFSYFQSLVTQRETLLLLSFWITRIVKSCGKKINQDIYLWPEGLQYLHWDDFHSALEQSNEGLAKHKVLSLHLDYTVIRMSHYWLLSYSFAYSKLLKNSFHWNREFNKLFPCGIILHEWWKFKVNYLPLLLLRGWIIAIFFLMSFNLLRKWFFTMPERNPVPDLYVYVFGSSS